MNELTDDIEYLFERAGISNFERLPRDFSERGRFAKLFSEFNEYLEAGKVQGYTWDKTKYNFDDYEEVIVKIDETIYLTLAQRYKELLTPSPPYNGGSYDLAFDIDGYLTEIDTGKIDVNYMNSRFEKYLKDLRQENISLEELQKTLNELHKSFASLSQVEQKFANIFLHDIESGEVELEEGKSFRDYITEYLLSAKNKQIRDMHNAIGVDMELLEKILELNVTEKSIDEYGRFGVLEKTADKDKAKEFFEKKEGKKIPMFVVNRNISKLLREFVLAGGFDINGDE